MNIKSLFSKKNLNNKYIAFTFDDGPSRYTKDILKILKKYNAKATFFVIGSRIDENKNILLDIINNNHEIGNHTYNHSNDADKNSLYKGIKDTQELITKYTNITPTLLRLPGGNLENIDTNKIKELDLSIIRWSIDSGDWFLADSDTIYTNVLNEIQDGSIILFHDIYKHTPEIINKLLNTISKQGYIVTTVSDAMKQHGVDIKSGESYYEAKQYEKQ